MNLFDLVVNDNKTQDVLKVGISKDTVIKMIREMTATTDIGILMDHHFCVDLHKKFLVPLPNIKTLMGQAIYYIKQNQKHHTEVPRSKTGFSGNIQPRRSSPQPSCSYQNSEARVPGPSRRSATSEISSDESERMAPTRKRKATEPIDTSSESEDDEQEVDESIGEDEENWEIIAIMHHTVNKDGTKTYRVQWKTDDRGEYWEDADNWVHETNMKCPELMASYERKLKEDIKKKRVILSQKALEKKRKREMKAKTHLNIADDKDVCTSSDEEAERREKMKRALPPIVDKKIRRKPQYTHKESSSSSEESSSESNRTVDQHKTEAIDTNESPGEEDDDCVVISSDEDEVHSDVSTTLEPEFDSMSIQQMATEPEADIKGGDSPNSEASSANEMVSSPQTKAESNALIASAKGPVPQEVMDEWAREWYAEAESGVTKALERNLRPHQCMLYQKNTDTSGYGRCLFLFLEGDELKADFIYFPFTGEHEDLMHQLLDNFMEQVNEMGVPYQLQIQKNQALAKPISVKKETS